MPFRTFTSLNLSGNPRLKTLWAELARDPGAFHRVHVPSLLGVVPDSDAVVPAPAQPAPGHGPNATVPPNAADMPGSEGAQVVSSAGGAAAAGGSGVETPAAGDGVKGARGSDATGLVVSIPAGAPPVTQPTPLRSALRGPHPSPTKSVRFDFGAEADTPDTNPVPSSPPPASATAPPALSTGLASARSQEGMELGTGALEKASISFDTHGPVPEHPDPAPQRYPLDGVVVPPMVAYDALGDVRFLRLRTLRLRGCVRLRDEAMDSLALCPNLTSLDLSGCHKISDDGVCVWMCVCGGGGGGGGLCSRKQGHMWVGDWNLLSVC